MEESLSAFFFRGAHGAARQTPRGGSATGRRRVIAALLMAMTLAAGCATPTLKLADPQLILQSDLFSFLRDGTTTRQEAVMKLGMPSAQMEGERILFYQLRADEEGKWHLVSPQWNVAAGMRTWSSGTCSLVLVFQDDGVLSKHSLVVAQ